MESMQDIFLVFVLYLSKSDWITVLYSNTTVRKISFKAFKKLVIYLF